eukprot:1989904-Amphidinium_carterae.2
MSTAAAESSQVGQSLSKAMRACILENMRGVYTGVERGKAQAAVEDFAVLVGNKRKPFQHG